MSPILNNANSFDAMKVSLLCILPSLHNNTMDTRKPTEAVFGTNMFAKNFIKYVTLLNISGKYFSQDQFVLQNYKILKISTKFRVFKASAPTL